MRRAAGRYSADPALAGLWSTLFVIAALSLVNIYIVKPLLHILSERFSYD